MQTHIEHTQISRCTMTYICWMYIYNIMCAYIPPLPCSNEDAFSNDNCVILVDTKVLIELGPYNIFCVWCNSKVFGAIAKIFWE